MYVPIIDSNFSTLGPGNDHYDFGQTIHFTSDGLQDDTIDSIGKKQRRTANRMDLAKMNPKFNPSAVPRGCILCLLSRRLKPQVLTIEIYTSSKAQLYILWP